MAIVKRLSHKFVALGLRVQFPLATPVGILHDGKFLMCPMGEKKIDLCIIGGAGHVGLPFGVVCANSGIKTVLLDINKDALEKIKHGVFPFKERGGSEALKAALAKGTLSMTDSPDVIHDSSFVLIVIGTPVDEYLSPRSGDIIRIIDKYLDYFCDGQIVILRSTVYPGITEKVQHYFDKKNKKVRLSFCPERVTQGYAIEEIKKLPQIVSAFDPETLHKVTDLIQKTTSARVITTTPIEAELAKLYTNAWRYIRFAVANQFFVIAHEHGLDYNRIAQAMKENYPRNQDLPSPGFAAGPCLLKDTMQLAAFTNNHFQLGHAAMLVNEGLVNYLMSSLKRTFSHDLKEKTLGILGMAFKAGSDDHRDSLSYKLRKIADVECKQVFCTDVHIQNPAFVSVEHVLQNSDIIILATPHLEYQTVDPSQHPHITFIDLWSFWPNNA